MRFWCLHHQWVSGCGSQPLYSHCNGFYQPAELVADWPRGGVVSAHGAFRNRARRKARSPFPEPTSAGKLQYSLPEQASPLFSHSSSRSRLTDCSKLTHPRSVSILGHFERRRRPQALIHAPGLEILTACMVLRRCAKEASDSCRCINRPVAQRPRRKASSGREVVDEK